MFTARSNSGRAFTLLEIMLAVGILGMMSLAIYRFVQTNITAMRISSSVQEVDARYDGLREFLTLSLQSLPQGSAAMSGDALKVGDRDRDELTWVCGAGPGMLTRYAAGDYRVSLLLRPPNEKSRRLDLGIFRKPKKDTAISHIHESWVPLIENVNSLQIRYFDPRLNGWVVRWTDTATLPRLLKVTIGRNDAATPVELIIPLGRTAL